MVKTQVINLKNNECLRKFLYKNSQLLENIVHVTFITFKHYHGRPVTLLLSPQKRLHLSCLVSEDLHQVQGVRPGPFFAFPSSFLLAVYNFWLKRGVGEVVTFLNFTSGKWVSMVVVWVVFLGHHLVLHDVTTSCNIYQILINVVSSFTILYYRLLSSFHTINSTPLP